MNRQVPSLCGLGYALLSAAALCNVHVYSTNLMQSYNTFHHNVEPVEEQESTSRAWNDKKQDLVCSCVERIQGWFAFILTGHQQCWNHKIQKHYQYWLNHFWVWDFTVQTSSLYDSSTWLITTILYSKSENPVEVDKSNRVWEKEAVEWKKVHSDSYLHRVLKGKSLALLGLMGNILVLNLETEWRLFLSSPLPSLPHFLVALCVCLTHL